MEKGQSRRSIGRQEIRACIGDEGESGTTEKAIRRPDRQHQKRRGGRGERENGPCPRPNVLVLRAGHAGESF